MWNGKWMFFGLLLLLLWFSVLLYSDGNIQNYKGGIPSYKDYKKSLEIRDNLIKNLTQRLNRMKLQLENLKISNLQLEKSIALLEKNLKEQKQISKNWKQSIDSMTKSLNTFIRNSFRDKIIIGAGCLSFGYTAGSLINNKFDIGTYIAIGVCVVSIIVKVIWK